MPGRYSQTPPINNGEGRGSSRAILRKIYRGVITGRIPFKPVRLTQNERLDHISAQNYGSSDYWWVIAAASGIGWGMQVPAGTIIRIPQNLGAILALRP